MSGATTKVPQNIDFCGGELRNFKFQNLGVTPSNLVESMCYYDTVNHKPQYHNGTALVDFGRVYSAGTGITISAGDEVSVTDYASLLKNTATGSNALTLLGTACSVPNGINIGYGSSADRECVSIGTNATTNNLGVAVGYGTEASYSYSTALGTIAKSTANGAIQIGYGTNSTAKTLSIGFYNNSATHYNWQLLDGTTGLIPDDRISSNIVKTSIVGVANGVASLGSDGKVPNSQLPSFVDDVVDAYIVSGATALSSGWLSATSGGSALTPETGKIYVVLSSGTYLNKTYRWSGTTYVEISASPGNATESAAGIAEIATNSEVSAGTDDTRIVTPLKAATYYQKKLTQGTGITISNNEISVTDYNYLCRTASVQFSEPFVPVNGVITAEFVFPFPIGGSVVIVQENEGNGIFTTIYPKTSFNTNNRHVTVEILSNEASVPADRYHFNCIGCGVNS